MLFVQFSDVKFSSTTTDLVELLSNVTNYYSRVSYGQLTIDWEVIAWDESAWLTLPRPMAYYGANVEGKDGKLEQL